MGVRNVLCFALRFLLLRLSKVSAPDRVKERERKKDIHSYGEFHLEREKEKEPQRLTFEVITIIH